MERALLILVIIGGIMITGATYVVPTRVTFDKGTTFEEAEQWLLSEGKEGSIQINRDFGAVSEGWSVTASAKAGRDYTKFSNRYWRQYIAFLQENANNNPAFPVELAKLSTIIGCWNVNTCPAPEANVADIVGVPSNIPDYAHPDNFFLTIAEAIWSRIRST